MDQALQSLQKNWPVLLLLVALAIGATAVTCAFMVASLLFF